MNWNYGFRVGEGQVKETRAQEAQQSMNLVAGSDMKKDIEATTEGAFVAIDNLVLDPPYQVVMQGVRRDGELAVSISIVTEAV